MISLRAIISGDAAMDPFRVGFLIAGVQKGGTYSLYRLLERHPEIGLSKSKEVHFFDDEASVDWSRPRYDRYHRNFSIDRRSRVFGEATPIYIYWPGSLERIRAYNPNTKLILLFRDPIERAYSAWCHQRRKSREPLSFSEAIREGRARISDPQGLGNRHFSYVERGFYAKQLRRALDLFPASNILSLDSSQLSRDPRALVQQVVRFLGLSEPNGVIEAIHANKRAPLKESDVVRADDVTLLADLFAGDVAELVERVDFSIEHWPISRLVRGEVLANDVASRLAKPGFANEDSAKGASA